MVKWLLNTGLTGHRFSAGGVVGVAAFAASVQSAHSCKRKRKRTNGHGKGVNQF